MYQGEEGGRILEEKLIKNVKLMQIFESAREEKQN
jgi:hypothetical protein